tara:strand:+ start:1189 stop:2298 length:1110 start_codon:yes stop_codon:yes gene_type:complete
MSAIATNSRDYNLAGPENQSAVDAGLVSADWYHSDIPRKVMKELMKRSDAPATRDTLLWIALIIISAIGAIAFWGTLQVIPFLIFYGVLYGSASDSRWHECGHGTAFRTTWKNDLVYHVASFMIMRNPISWRWSHARHHTDTIIVGRDPEIALMRPTAIAKTALLFIGVPGVFKDLQVLICHGAGRMSNAEKDYIPESEQKKAAFWARVHIVIYAATVLVAIIMQSFLPVVLIGGPRIYGVWHAVMTGLLQHGGLAEDVLDHRLNSRTVYLNPVSRWIYWNMNYHVEHHMFPMVPYFALPRLHALIKDDLPAPSHSIFAAYHELLGSIRRQRLERDYYIRKDLPPTAKPYREDLHTLDITRSHMRISTP